MTDVLSRLTRITAAAETQVRASHERLQAAAVVLAAATAALQRAQRSLVSSHETQQMILRRLQAENTSVESKAPAGIRLHSVSYK
jgi:hypothetical protein